MTRQRLAVLLAVLIASVGLAGTGVVVPQLAPTPAQAADQVFPCGGWIPAGAVCQQEHPDQGKDLVTNWRGIVQAPSSGCVVAFGSDRPFPNGFGPIFVLARIDSGPFASPSPYYIGHTTAILHPGEYNAVSHGGEWCFGFGTALARADQGRPGDICPDLSSCEGYRLTVNGGWVELGQQEPSGALGPYSDTGHWYDALLRAPLIIRDPYDLYPDVVFVLWHGIRAQERNTVRTWDSRGCEQPARRPACTSSLLNMKLERDRDIWVAGHKLDAHGWHRLRHPIYHDGIGRRVQGLQRRITAPVGQRCSIARCG